MQPIDPKLGAIVATSARRGRVFAVIFAVLGVLFVAMGANEMFAVRGERRAYSAEVDDIRRHGVGNRESRCFQQETSGSSCRDASNQASHCQAQRECATEDVLDRAERAYLFAGHSAKKGLLFLSLGFLQLLFAVISRVRSARNYARAYRLLCEPHQIAKIMVRTANTPRGPKATVVGGEMLEIYAADGTHCYFNATHDQLADLLEMLAAHGMIVERDIRSAANSGRPIVTPPSPG